RHRRQARCGHPRGRSTGEGPRTGGQEDPGPRQGRGDTPADPDGPRPLQGVVQAPAREGTQAVNEEEPLPVRSDASALSDVQRSGTAPWEAWPLGIFTAGVGQPIKQTNVARMSDKDERK